MLGAAAESKLPRPARDVRQRVIPRPTLVRPVFTFSEAAKLTRTSRSTIKRRHAAGSFPNAEQDETGTWVIPIGDLPPLG